MSTRLRPLSADEVATYVPHLRRTYAAELAEHHFLDADAAAARAERSARDAFPDGVPVPGHWLFAVEDGEGTRVGNLWLGEPHDGVSFISRCRPTAVGVGWAATVFPGRRPWPAAWAEAGLS